MAGFLERLNDLVARGVPVVSVTVVDAIGSTPQDRGAKMLVTLDGLHSGTVGGGRVETRALAEALEMLQSRETATRFVQWNLNRDVGMTCGGTVKLFFGAFNVGIWNIAVFGAGHVAQALTRLLCELDCHVTCVDPRAEWLEKLAGSPRLSKILSTDLPSELAGLPRGAFVILMTMGHATDLPVLIEALRSYDFPYLGAIGSNAKARQLQKGLAEAGLSPELQRKFHCPIGLDLGSNHPWEIAVSVAAQLIQLRDLRRETGQKAR